LLHLGFQAYQVLCYLEDFSLCEGHQMTTCYTKVSKGSFDLYSVNSFHILYTANKLPMFRSSQPNCQQLLFKKKKAKPKKS